MVLQNGSYIFLLILLLVPTSLHSLPLSTMSRWIVDARSTHRVKLRCGNWAGHMEPMVPEGLDRQPLRNIVATLASLGFNCVRLTWAIHMHTRSSQVKVAQSLESLGLTAARDGIRRYNPNLLDLTVVDAQAAVVDALGQNGIMVILDNHVSKPQWCCSGNDGNGWFGDRYFDPDEWLRGLNLVATRYKGKSQVVGMSLRNELRGQHQDEQVWHRYMQAGATTVHNANPDLLVIVSGLNYDSNLGFLRNPNLRINLPANKLVYEVHRYAFSIASQNWLNKPLNQVCGNFIKWFEDAAGFLINSPRDKVPLLVSEFGVDQRGTNEADNRFLPCFLAHLTGADLDWALWAFQGSYYVRSGSVGMEEMYGVLDGSWAKPRNPAFKGLFQLPQSITQSNHRSLLFDHHSTILSWAKNQTNLFLICADFHSKAGWHYILYHPLSGDCAHASRNNVVRRGDCQSRSRWSYDKGRIRLVGASSCLKVAGDGQLVVLSNDCSSPQSYWSILSDSKLHIGAKDGRGTQLCMDGKGSTVRSSRCICLGGDCHEDPRSQWFKLVPTNV
uniref:Glycoside hydrolase family 5 domain-containing protein n=1 Tax=Kalanchoe fedtschenkoi TaxID=63787 RepID=A0A7N0TR71_KALFE